MRLASNDKKTEKKTKIRALCWKGIRGRWHTNTDARGRIEAAARTDRRTDRQAGRQTDKQTDALWRGGK